MRVLRALQEQGADNLVALTFNLDLPFFEDALYRPLHGRGCRNVAVLCDPGQFQVSLEDVPALRHLGRDYVCLPASVAGSAFHPKLVLLTARDSGFLIIGSANISTAGLTSNLEAVTAFSYSEKSPDEHARCVFRWAYDYLRRLFEADVSLVLEERIDLLWRTTGWLRREPRPYQESFAAQGCWPLHNLDYPLLDQLVERWSMLDGSEVQEAIVVSPYFDRRALALGELMRRFRPRELTVVTEPRAPGMDPQEFRRTLETSGATWRAVSPESDGRRLHAKALALRTGRGVWLLTGSPNFTSPALLHSAVKGNAELAVLRYETGPRLVDSFLDPVLGSAGPLELDWEPRLDDEERTDSNSEGYRILSAQLSGRVLSVTVHPSVPPHARLRVELRGSEEGAFVPEWWTTDGRTIELEVPESAAFVLFGSASVGIVAEIDGNEVRSTRMAVHDLEVIRRNSEPLRNGARARVPATLVSLESTQHLDLLDLLKDLLAMNPQQLRNKAGVSANTVRELERERALGAQKDEYDPEAMIVEEKVRMPEIRSGAELYVDYDDRTLYQDIMAALHAAVHSAAPPLETSSRAGPQPSSGPVEAETSGSQEANGESDPRDQHAVHRVVKRFSRLVDDFERGMRDAEYLAEVPALYLKKMFYVLLTYLRLLHVEELVDEESFIVLSERLFAALAPERGTGGWPLVASSTDEEMLARDEIETHYWKQTWLHLYLVADLCLIDREERIPDLARLLRRVSRQLLPPTVLRYLPDELLRDVWRHSIYPGWEPREVDEIVRDIGEYCGWYNEQTLTRELRHSPLTQAYVEYKDVQTQSVPTLIVVEPWNDDQLNHYWRAFAILCDFPKFRKSARLVVKDANIARENRSKDHRLVLFYRADNRELRMQINPVGGVLYQCVVVELSLAEIRRLENFTAVVGHENAKTLRGRKPPLEKC